MPTANPTVRRGRKKSTPKTGGRQRGTSNKATVEVRTRARRVVEDAEVQARTLEMARSGRFAPAVLIEKEPLSWSRVHFDVHEFRGAHPNRVKVHFPD